MVVADTMVSELFASKLHYMKLSAYIANLIPMTCRRPTFLEQRRNLMAQVVREAYERLATGSGNVHEPEQVDVEDMISGGESDLVELKSTLRVNLHTRERDGRMEHAILKTLAGFLNKDGGTLVVGVADDGSPVGIEVDGFDNEDRMGLHLVNIVNERMGPNVWAHMHANFDDYEDGRVLVVRCERSPKPVYVQEGQAERFYVRTGPSTTELQLSSANDYIGRRFN